MTEQFVKCLTSFYLNLNSGPAGNVMCGLVRIPLLPGPRVLLMGYGESSVFPPGLGSKPSSVPLCIFPTELGLCPLPHKHVLCWQWVLGASQAWVGR